MKLKNISCDECKDGHYHSNEGRSFARQCYFASLHNVIWPCHNSKCTRILATLLPWKVRKIQMTINIKTSSTIFIHGDMQDFIGGEAFNINETTMSLNPKPSPSPLCTYFKKWTMQLNVATHLGFAHDYAWLWTPLHNHIYRPSLDFCFPSKTTKHLLWACFQKC